MLLKLSLGTLIFRANAGFDVARCPSCSRNWTLTAANASWELPLLAPPLFPAPAEEAGTSKPERRLDEGGLYDAKVSIVALLASYFRRLS